MKSTTFALTLSALIGTAFADGYFTVISARSGSPIHLEPLSARGGKFYLGGGPPSSYCPTQVGSSCPPGTSTTLIGGNGGLSMGVVVPGGQQAYVAPDGSLSYTQAHSAYIPTGSIVDQFSITAPQNGFGHLSFESGLVACPQSDGNWQVFGQVQGGNYGPDCLGFDALTSEAQQPGAWQY